MNTSRLFHFLFQGNLVKRIAIGLVLGILVALVNESVKNSSGIDLASSFGVKFLLKHCVQLHQF